MKRYMSIFCCIVLITLHSTVVHASDLIQSNMHVLVTDFIEGHGQPGNPPISDRSFPPIQNARVIVIDERNGSIVANGLTDKKGEVWFPITVDRNPLFPFKDMGTVTVIAVANRYNEGIQFNLPVNEMGNSLAGAKIVLQRVDQSKRNEPQFIGNLHRFTVFDFLNNYAKQIGLTRQSIKRQGFEPPWSPNIVNSNN